METELRNSLILNVFARFDKPIGGVINPVQITKSTKNNKSLHKFQDLITGKNVSLSQNFDSSEKLKLDLDKNDQRDSSFMSNLLAKSKKEKVNSKKVGLSNFKRINSNKETQNKKENKKPNLEDFICFVIKKSADLVQEKSKESNLDFTSKVSADFIREISNFNQNSKMVYPEFQPLVENLKKTNKEKSIKWKF